MHVIRNRCVGETALLLLLLRPLLPCLPINRGKVGGREGRIHTTPYGSTTRLTRRPALFCPCSWAYHVPVAINLNYLAAVLLSVACIFEMRFFLFCTLPSGNQTRTPLRITSGTHACTDPRPLVQALDVPHPNGLTAPRPDEIITFGCIRGQNCYYVLGRLWRSKPGRTCSQAPL